FKVFNIKFIRIEITVPTYNIERMGCINEIPDLIFFFYFDEEFTFFIFWFKKFGCYHISFTERGVFQKLAEFISVSFRSINGRMAFQNKKNIIFIAKMNLINSTARNNQVIAKRKMKISHESF